MGRLQANWPSVSLLKANLTIINYLNNNLLKTGQSLNILNLGLETLTRGILPPETERDKTGQARAKVYKEKKL